MTTRNKSGLITLAALLIVLAGIFLFRHNISDWYKLRGYTPPSEIVEVADQITLKNEWRRLFYVNHPEIADKNTFNEHCRKNEFTIVLGCYLSGQSGIFLLEVDDERLEGVVQVTAAHELLHAAYERLGSKEKSRIDTLLTQTFVNIKDKRIRETIESYRESDPTIVTNELHSILGSEVRTLPDELEQYYSRYFTDRKKVVSFSEQYEAAFIERRNKVREYDQELSELRVSIDSLSAQLTQTNSELQSQRSEMNQLRSSGKTSQYNAQVPSYNAKVSGYNRDVDRLQGMVSKYNQIVEIRNQLAAEEHELVEAIDSREVVPEEQ